MNRKPRKEYYWKQKKKTTDEVSSNSEEETELDIDKWDNWLGEDEEEQLEVVTSVSQSSD